MDLAQAKSGLKGRGGKVIKDDYLKYYCEFLIDKIRKATGETYPLKDLKIAVDAGNGAGGFFVDRVLKPLGADTSASQYLEPDGMFPNHAPNPEDPEAMRHISKRVLKAKPTLALYLTPMLTGRRASRPTGRRLTVTG